MPQKNWSPGHKPAFQLEGGGRGSPIHAHAHSGCFEKLGGNCQNQCKTRFLSYVTIGIFYFGLTENFGIWPPNFLQDPKK